MNCEWSGKNKIAQNKLKKSSFHDGINEFIFLRDDGKDDYWHLGCIMC